MRALVRHALGAEEVYFVSGIFRDFSLILASERAHTSRRGKIKNKNERKRQLLLNEIVFFFFPKFLFLFITVKE